MNDFELAKEIMKENDNYCIVAKCEDKTDFDAVVNFVHSEGKFIGVVANKFPCYFYIKNSNIVTFSNTECYVDENFDAQDNLISRIYNDDITVDLGMTPKEILISEIENNASIGVMTFVETRNGKKFLALYTDNADNKVKLLTDDSYINIGAYEDNLKVYRDGEDNDFDIIKIKITDVNRVTSLNQITDVNDSFCDNEEICHTVWDRTVDEKWDRFAKICDEHNLSDDDIEFLREIFK